jgi:hypothetical protein
MERDLDAQIGQLEGCATREFQVGPAAPTVCVTFHPAAHPEVQRTGSSLVRRLELLELAVIGQAVLARGGDAQRLPDAPAVRRTAVKEGLAGNDSTRARRSESSENWVGGDGGPAGGEDVHEGTETAECEAHRAPAPAFKDDVQLPSGVETFVMASDALAMLAVESEIAVRSCEERYAEEKAELERTVRQLEAALAFERGVNKHQVRVIAELQERVEGSLLTRADGAGVDAAPAWLPVKHSTRPARVSFATEAAFSPAPPPVVESMTSRAISSVRGALHTKGQSLRARRRSCPAMGSRHGARGESGSFAHPAVAASGFPSRKLRSPLRKPQSSAGGGAKTRVRPLHEMPIDASLLCDDAGAGAGRGAGCGDVVDRLGDGSESGARVRAKDLFRAPPPSGQFVKFEDRADEEQHVEVEGGLSSSPGRHSPLRRSEPSVAGTGLPLTRTTRDAAPGKVGLVTCSSTGHTGLNSVLCAFE